LIAQGDLSMEKIAVAVGIDRNTLWWWRTAPDFAARVLSLPTGGDWYFILEAIRNGCVAYEAALLNHHRRHGDSVTSVITASNPEAPLRTRQIVHRHVLHTYETDLAIKLKMAEHVAQLWDQLFPGRPADEMESLYSLDRLGEFATKPPESTSPAA